MKFKSNRKEAIKKINQGLIRGLDAAAIHYQGKVKQTLNQRGSNRSGPGGPSAPGQPPAKQSGALGRSAQVDRSKNKGKRPKVRIGTNLPYAPIQEFGGTINAKGRALAVPIHPDAKRASQQGRGARSFSDLWMLKRPGKAPLLMRSKEKMTDLMYALVKRVVLPARPAWRPTLKREAKTMTALIRRGVRVALRGPGGAA
ncbi:MAG: hypothetical protein ACPGVG_05660 [Mycobacterium sp.]